MSKDDWIRIKHMLDAAEEVRKSVAGRQRDDLEKDYVWTLGLVKCVEIIGEAAAQVARDTKASYPQIPWSQIIGMRNRLIHAYFDIDLDQVWKTAIEDLPPLVTALERILEEGSDL